MYIHRKLEDTINKYLKTPEIIAVLGARQTGKTTLLRKVQSKLENSSFITFEDIDARSLFDNSLKDFIKLYIEPYRYIFIDEFQYAKTGGRSLKFIFDTVKDRKLFITGSSSPDLTVRAVKHLAGRLMTFTLYPFSFEEFLNAKDLPLYELYRTDAGNRQLEPVLLEKFYKHLHDFIRFGGYPRVVTASDDDEKKEILKNIMNIYLLKEVRDLFGLTDDYKVLNLIKALAIQAGNIISYGELAAITHQQSGQLKKSLNMLEKTYIVHLLKPFFTNKRTELVKNPKAYFIDNGLRNAVLNDFRNMNVRADKGALYENFVLTEYLKKGFSLRYWRTKSKAEVDFVINDTLPVEVKSGLTKPVVGKSLYSFISKYKSKSALILNESLFTNINAENAEAYFAYHFSDIAEKLLRQSS